MNGEKDMQKEKMRQAIELMKQGEEKGFNYIYGETYNFVYSRAKLAINDEQEVQDLVQEVYVAAYQNIESLKNPDSLYAWLGSITMRQGAKMANKKKNHVLLTEENEGMFEELPDESVKLENDAIVKENAGILKGLLEKLSPEQKSAIVSFYYDGLKVEQIAELTETSTGTIKSRLHLARKRLQEYIVELEKKENCSLRGFSVPLLLLAVKMLLEETTLSQASAQGIYNQVCNQVGVQASTLAFQSAGAGSAAMANSGGNAGVRTGLNTGLTGYMKGQGTSMNKLLSKLAGLGKMKIAAIATGVVAIAGAGTATGIYVHQQAEVKEAQAQEKLEKEEQAAGKKKAQEEQEKLIADLTERYQKAEELRDNLILEDAVIEILNRDFTIIKTALEEETVDETIEETMASLEKNLEGYRQQNEQYLTEQRNAIMDYHNEMFPQENQDAWDKVLAEYQELFDAVKYKDANAKLTEVNTGIMAFLQENTTEVASGETEGTSGNEDTGNASSGNSNTGNGSGNGNSNTGSGSGNGNSNTGSGSGNGSSGNGTGSDSGNSNTSNGGSAGSTPSTEPATPVEEPVQSGNGWSDEEYRIMNEIAFDWFNYWCTDDEAQAQLSARLPGRTCTLVHYPVEQAEEARNLWNSLDSNVYEKSQFWNSDVDGAWFIYGK